MKILKENIIGLEKFSEDFKIDFSDYEINDALVEKILECECHIDGFKIAEDEFNFQLETKSKVAYLDARTLEKLVINVDFIENIPFTFNKQKADSFEIDYFDEEIDIDQLVFELLIAYIPFNYSENTSELITKEAEFNQSKPFEHLFNKKK